MWDKTKAYKNSRTVKRVYDLMFENFFFLLSFSCVKITFHFQPIGVIFPSFSCVRLKVPVHGNLGGVRGGRCPLSPPSGSATACEVVAHGPMVASTGSRAKFLAF